MSRSEGAENDLEFMRWVKDEATEVELESIVKYFSDWHAVAAKRELDRRNMEAKARVAK